MNKLKYFLVFLLLLFSSSCGFNAEKIKMEISNKSAISSKSKGIYLNGAKLNYYEGRRVSAGAQTVSFKGNITLEISKVIETQDQNISGTCLVILPLCVLGEIVNAMHKPNISSGYTDTKDIESMCIGTIHFTTLKGGEYIVEIKKTIDSLPRLTILKYNSKWETIKEVEMKCSPNQSLKNGTAQSAAP